MKKGVNQEDIQEMNRSLVIHLLREKGSCSRAQLAQMTGLKPTTITNVINNFIKWGLVKEEGLMNGGKGRRAISVTLNTTDYRVIGVRLSRKYFLVGLFDISGKQIEAAKFLIEKQQTPETVFAQIKKQIGELIQGHADNEILAIGFAIPGPFTRKEGRIVLMSEFPDWQNIFIKSELEKTFHLPTYLEHDANVGTLAEYWNMGISMDKTLVYIAAGQGIGAGIIVGGKLYKGAMGSAGEIGHTSIEYNGLYCECGNRGCLEKYCSSIAFPKAISKKIEEGSYSILKKDCTFAEAEVAVQKGDRLAIEEYIKACEFLSVGIINIINFLNPDFVVIGDDMSTVAPNILLDVVKKSVATRVLPEFQKYTTIKVSNISNDSILAGACIMAIEEIFKTPSMFSSEKSATTDKGGECDVLLNGD